MPGLAQIRLSIWCAAAAILVFQLFVPPVIGLSDQGDFARVIGRFGYSRAEKDVPLSEGYLSRKFVRDPHSRYPYLEQPTSEYIFVVTALAVNKVVSRDGSLDLTTIGAVHALAFLAAFWWLLRAIGLLRLRPAPTVIIWAIAAIAFTDVGYVAYWNSFFSEPASAIFFVALLAESIAISARGPSRAALSRWCAFAALFTIAKPQNFAFAVVLAPFALRLGWIAKNRWAGAIGAAAIAAAGIAAIATFPPSNVWATAYNQIFLAILPDSHDAAADLRELGIDARYASYAATGAWTPRSAIQELVGNGVIGKQVTPATVGFFYLHHPARMLRRARVFLPLAFSLRPEWCGNFELSAHRGHGAKATSFTLWSSFHERVLEPVGPAILLLLALAPLLAIALWFALPPRRLQIEFAGVLVIGALLAFGVAAYGDAWDNVKHCFLFNLELDACLIAGGCALASRFSVRVALPLIALLACCACDSKPWYAIPQQQPSFDGFSAPNSRVVAMDDADADLRIVRDIQPAAGIRWRWTLQRPAVKVRMHTAAPVRYTIDFTLPEATFKDTGPVTIAFLVNDRVLDRIRYTASGEQHYEKIVPSDWIQAGKDNIAGAEIDKLWTGDDGRQFGFILTRMGFAP